MKKGFLLIAILFLVSCASCNNPKPGTSSDTSGDNTSSDTPQNDSSKENEDNSNNDNPYKDDDNWHRIG